jgi:hypothetical protein
MCTLREAMSQLSAVPVSAVRIANVKTEAGVSYPVLVDQADGSCGGSRRLSEHNARRAQSVAVSTASAEVMVDVARTTLTSLPAANAEVAVRSQITAAFANPALIDALFSQVTLAACSAQGVPANVCPNPPSLALSVSSPAGATPAQAEGGSVPVPIVIGAVVGTALVVAVVAVAVAWWIRTAFPPKPPPESPGLVIRHMPATLAAPPPGPPAPISFISPVPRAGSKRFEVRTVFNPTGAVQ